MKATYIHLWWYFKNSFTQLWPKVWMHDTWMNVTAMRIHAHPHIEFSRWAFYLLKRFVNDFQMGASKYREKKRQSRWMHRWWIDLIHKFDGLKNVITFLVYNSDKNCWKKKWFVLQNKSDDAECIINLNNYVKSYPIAYRKMQKSYVREFSSSASLKTNPSK